jgi:nicotinamidase-related amidase
LFAPGTAAAEIAIEATPLPEEPVIEKTLPNAFAGTDLREHLAALERKDIVLVGFMTHMCVEATARAAIDLGFKPIVVASAAATRDLPNPLDGSVLPANEVHRNALAALADRFATIAVNSGAIPH